MVRRVHLGRDDKQTTPLPRKGLVSVAESSRSQISTDVGSHNQLELILNVLGTPTINEYNAITSKRSKEYLRNLPFRKRRTFDALYPDANPLAIDFMSRTLTCE